MELLYCPFGMENGFTNPFTQDFTMTSLEKVIKSGVNGLESLENEKAAIQKKREVIIRGVLSVTVISAEDLPAVDLMGKADPYVVLTMKKSDIRNKTRVKSWLLKFFSQIGNPLEALFVDQTAWHCMPSFFFLPSFVVFCVWGLGRYLAPCMSTVQ